MVIKTSGRLLKEYPKGYSQSFNRAFTNISKIAGFNNGLPAPQPVFVEGLELEEFRPFPIDEHVHGAVLYRDSLYSLTLPHIAGEWKGPDGSMKEARMQSAYDGAVLVYARNKALAYMKKSDPPSYAEVTTFITDGTNLNIYAHYAAPSAEDEDILEYHQYLVSSTNIRSTHQGYKDGRKSLRNAQDYARDRLCSLNTELRHYWKQSGKTHATATEDIAPFTDLEPPPSVIGGHEEASQLEEEHEEEEEEDCVIVHSSSHHSSHHSSLHQSLSKPLH